MSEIILLGCFALLIVIASWIIYLPLKQSKSLLALIIAIFCISAFYTYQQWGGWQIWQDYKQQLLKKQQIKTLLASINGPEDLIKQLKQRLQDNPQSAKGWYLLGRLYSSQNQWQLAANAFAKSQQLNPVDEQNEINYIQALWYLNHQQFNAQVRQRLKKLLHKNPQQPDALALLAQDAYRLKDFQQAIGYWEQLLQLTASTSEEAAALRKAIAEAQKQLIAQAK